MIDPITKYLLLKEDYATNIKLAGAAAVTTGIALSKLVDVVYDRYMSEAGKSCKGKSGPDRTLCINNYRLKALRSIDCRKAKNTDKCKKYIDKRIKVIQSKISKAKQRKK